MRENVKKYVTPGGGEVVTECTLPFAALSIDSIVEASRPLPIQIYVRCPMLNDHLVLIELDKGSSNLETLEREVSKVTGVPVELIHSEGLYKGHGKRKRVTSLSQLL